VTGVVGAAAELLGDRTGEMGGAEAVFGEGRIAKPDGGKERPECRSVCGTSNGTVQGGVCDRHDRAGYDCRGRVPRLF
jgi:hypothetical protein